MPDITITVNGKKVVAPAGTLLIDACQKAGIQIPSFCYYPNFSVQDASHRFEPGERVVSTAILHGLQHEDGLQQAAA